VNNELQNEFLKIELLLTEGRFTKSSEALLTLEKLNNIGSIDKVKLRLLRVKLLIKQGRFAKAIPLIKNVINTNEKRTYPLIEIRSRLLLAEAFWRTGRLDESLLQINQCELDLDLIPNGKATEYTLLLGEVAYNKGVIYSRKGELDSALSNLEKALEIRQEFQDNYGIGEALNSIGVVHYYKGHLAKSLGSYKQSLDFKEKVNNIQQLAIAFNNIGDVYHIQGELKKAKYYYSKGLTLFEETGNKEHISAGLHNLGKVYYQTGETAESLKYFENAMKLYEGLDNKLGISENLYQLIQVSLDISNLEQSQRYLDYLASIAKQMNNKVVKQRYNISQALLLKSTKRIRYKMKAMEYLNSIIEDELVNSELTTTAMLHSADLLLYELKLYGEEGILRELKEIAQQLLKLAETQNLHSLLAETYLLQSRLSVIELDIKNARHLLYQAKDIADERDLRKLSELIAYELTLIPSWESIKAKKPKLKEITDLLDMEDLISRMIRRKVFRNKKEMEAYVREAKSLFKSWK
jgi:tetratricopeptide (TPR) repeat protein